MFNLIMGFVLGVAACTIGFSGMAHVLDKGVTSLKAGVEAVAK